MSDTELAWLAGLLEGEGAFILQRVPPTEREAARIRIKVSLQMTDRDVVEKVRDIVGLGTVRRAKTAKDHYKPTYQWQISAMGAVAALLQLLAPHMGMRRQQQIAACLAAVEEAGGVPRRRRRHGQSKYQYDGCRCDICYQAKSQANARRNPVAVV